MHYLLAVNSHVETPSGSGLGSKCSEGFLSPTWIMNFFTSNCNINDTCRILAKNFDLGDYTCCEKNYTVPTFPTTPTSI